MPQIKFRPDTVNIEERYKKALDGLQNGTFSSLSEAAQAYSLSKSSLGHRKNGRQSRQKAHEDQQLLSPAAERAVVRWCTQLDDYGFPPRLDILLQLVRSLVTKEQGLEQDIGKNWITRFLNRHPEVAAKYASRIDRQRAYASNPRTVQDHFNKLGKVIRAHNIRPRGITNCDEKGIIMGYSSKTKVITRRGRKNPRVKQDGKREMITILEAVSADGYVFPTFMITKGATHRVGWYQNVEKETDRSTRFAVSPKGWTDDELAMIWLKEVYEPFSRGRTSEGETRLLILDGHASHITYDFCKYCEDHNIIVFCLPAHSTHLLQPLDVGLFAPLQRYYGKAVEDYILSTNVGITKNSFFPLYKKAREQAYTTSNIENAFRATGIVPLNPRAVLGKMQAPTRSCPPPTHSERSFPVESTPYTKHNLRDQTNRALQFVRTATEGAICRLILRF
jgi:hypothetical protein